MQLPVDPDVSRETYVSDLKHTNSRTLLALQNSSSPTHPIPRFLIPSPGSKHPDFPHQEPLRLQCLQ